MPQRTNGFQELVTLVQRALAPVGAKVTSSALVDVSGQEGQREIDVLIESNVGPYNMKIAVEAKDEGRKMDQTRFEQILAKYQSEGSIKVNKLVVVTHHGFYETVIKRATLLGSQVELLTYAEVDVTDWAGLLPKTFVFRIAPHFCKLKFTPPIDEFDEPRLLRDAHVWCSHGTDHGTTETFLATYVRSRVLPSLPTLFDDMDKHAQATPNGQALATLAYNSEHDHWISIDNKTFPFTQVDFSIHVVSAKTPMEYGGCQITSTSGQSQIVPMAKATAGGKRFQLVIPDGLKSKQIVLRIDNEHPTAEDRRKLRKDRQKKAKAKTNRKRSKGS